MPTNSPTRSDHLQAVLLALLCSVLFLRSALLPGNALVPHPPELLDVPREQAIADGRYDATDALRGNVGMTDKYAQSLAWDRILQDRLRTFDPPHWTNDIGGGAPFVPQMAQPWQPINLLLLLVPSVQWYGWWYLVHQVLFGWFAYAFFRRLGCSHESALLGLVAAVLGLWTQGKVHHSVILTAALSLWPMLSATHELLAVGAIGPARRRAIAWLGMWTGLSWSTGFVVVALQATYLTLLLAMWWTWHTPRGERLRRLLPFGIGLGLGGLLSLANMLPILWASAESARQAFTAARQAETGFDWDHSLGFLWPDLLSWAADRFYPASDANGPGFTTRMPWSEWILVHQPFRSDGAPFHNWVESTLAIGLLPFVAASLALLHRATRPLALLLLGTAAVAFGMATAKEPFLTLARLVPGFAAGDLRRLAFLVVMAMVLLATLGVDAQLRSERRGPMLLVGGLVAATSVVALLWLAGPADAPALTRAFAELFAADREHPMVKGHSVDEVVQWMQATGQPGEAEHNRTMLTTTAWRALLVLGLGLAALWLRARWRAGVWIALTIGELLHSGLGPVQAVPAVAIATPPRVLAPVLAANPANGDRPRLCRLTPPGSPAIAALLPNLPGFLGCEDGQGYNPLPPARYEQFFAAIDPSCVYGGAGVGAFHSEAALRHPLADLYGLRFVLTKQGLATSPQLVERTPPGTGAYRLYERTTTLPRASFVHELDLMPDREARLAALAKPDRDVARRMVLEDASAPSPAPAPSSPATCTIDVRVDEYVRIRVQTAAAGYLRLADPFDAGWRASLDDAPTPLYVADHYLRAVFVPAGEHVVEFRYDAPRVVWPLRITLLLWGVLAWLWWSQRRRA